MYICLYFAIKRYIDSCIFICVRRVFFRLSADSRAAWEGGTALL